MLYNHSCVKLMTSMPNGVFQMAWQARVFERKVLPRGKLNGGGVNMKQKPARDSLLVKKISTLLGRARCAFVRPDTGERCPRYIDFKRFPKAQVHYQNHSQALCRKHFRILIIGLWRCQYFENGRQCQTTIDLRADREAFRAALLEKPVFCVKHRSESGSNGRGERDESKSWGDEFSWRMASEEVQDDPIPVSGFGKG